MAAGIAPCLEILVDVPSYVASVKASGSSGWTDVAPAVKWQISPLPGKIDLSVTAGVFLPTGCVYRKFHLGSWIESAKLPPCLRCSVSQLSSRLATKEWGHNPVNAKLSDMF
jgi:hypothetical protein